MWLFLAISYAETNRHGELRGVLESGDAINKAIFTPQELRRGFAKLLVADLISEHDLRFTLTTTGQELIQKVGHIQTLYEQWKLLNDAVGATCGANDHSQFEDAEWPFPQLSDTTIEEAYAEYKAEAERELREVFAKLSLNFDEETYRNLGKLIPEEN